MVQLSNFIQFVNRSCNKWMVIEFTIYFFYFLVCKSSSKVYWERKTGRPKGTKFILQRSYILVVLKLNSVFCQNKWKFFQHNYVVKAIKKRLWFNQFYFLRRMNEWFWSIMNVVVFRFFFLILRVQFIS